jgi:hypothetical protein
MAVELEWADELRSRASQSLGIPSGNLLVAATHTHSATGGLMSFSGPLGPALKPLFGISEGDFDGVMYEYTLRRSLESLAQAANALRPAELAVGTEEAAGIASDRTGRGDQMDDTCTVLRVTDETGDCVAALLHFTCHPTVLGDADHGISGDFPGMASSLIERALGNRSVVLFLNGALGNVSTRFTRASASYAESKRMGRLIAGAGLKALSRATQLSAPDITTRSATANLPSKAADSLGDAEARAKELGAAFERAMNAGHSHGELRKLKTALQGAEIACALRPHLAALTHVSVPMQLFAFGESLTYAALPGELFSTIGKQIESAFSGSMVRVVGPANGYLGYFPDRGAFEEGGYEADASLLAPDAGEQLVSFVGTSLLG